nr:ABC transporter ATP-binding protein [uncultured Treponema sp.]
MKTLLRLSRLITPLFPVMSLAVIFGTLGYLCAVAIPTLGIMALSIKIPLIFLILAGVLRGILHYIEQYCNHYIAFTLLARIRNIIFNKLRLLCPAKLDGKQKGNLISILTGDIELLELFYAHTVSPVCIAILVSLTVSVFLLHYHWIFALTALCSYILVGIVIPCIVQKKSIKCGTEHRELFSKMNSFLLDSLRGILQTIQFGTGNKKLLQMKTKSEELSKSQKKLSQNGGFTAALISGTVFLCDIIMLITAFILYKNKTVDFTSCAICTAALYSSFGPVIAVASLGSSLSQTIASGSRVLSLLDEKPVVKEVSGEKTVKTFEGADVKNVDFSYEKEKILSDISLSFSKNKIIGIQGKSGSGKSTLLKLLMRFWDTNRGTISINDCNIKNINTSDLRKIESYVTQETVLFHDTIENNIRIAKLNASKKEIIEACKKASVHDFIMSLPKGYDTQIAELGENFSGGERQRLGLARSFLRKNSFLLLDEPTSNLDSFNEKIILDSVKKESSNKTVVLVSHRDSTLKICSKKYRIESIRKS